MWLRLAALLSACWLGGAAAADSAAPADATALLRAIEREIGDAACDTDAQCHSIAVGAKACGGPEAYLAWSDQRARAAPLTELAARHRAASELENLRNRLQSDCALAPDPGAVCRPRASDGRRVCQLGLGGRVDVS